MRLSRSFPLLSLLAFNLGAQTPDSADFFERKVRPVLVKNCQGCHNAKLKTSGLDLSTPEGFVQGGAGGPVKDLLVSVIGYEDRLKMPPTGKLKDEDRAVLTAWATAGAPWPGAPQAGAVVPLKGMRKITDADRRYWAFRPVTDPKLPAITDAAWVKSPVDRFILAKLEEKKLRPAPPASKVTLLRRVTYDLIGLPPTPEELQNFLADKGPDAFAKVVDRLLASPRYGEQWGRHWLDLARYADSTGNDEDHRYPYAWRYRDYVIDAFNKDLPYDQFVREQLAGDLLPAEDGSDLRRRHIVATGFLALGPKAIAQQDKKKMLYDVYDEQVEVTSRAFMGLTVACARCHDHKFDPILTKDYYSMAGIFANTRSFRVAETHVSQLLYRPLAPSAEYKRYQSHREALARKNLEIESLTDEQMEAYVSQFAPRLADYMLAAREVERTHADVAKLAQKRGLDDSILTKWVKYLKPTDKGRTHLQPWEEAQPTKLEEVARTYQTAFESRHKEWNKTVADWRMELSKANPDDDAPPPARPKFQEDKDRFFYEVYFTGPFSIPAKEREKAFSSAAREQIATLKAEAAELKKTMPTEPDMACAVEEGEPVQQKVFLRGDYNAPGPDAPKAFPVVLASLKQPEFRAGSGRLELAEWLTQPDHPLTARVMVNRIWQGHFGEGIVRTPDNFGRMGERPLNPELLDWLATRFVENGWSVKQMHRLILLSSAYQMSTELSPEAAQADPENKLLSHFARRRLTVEEMRDGLLAIDGSLDLTMGGSLQKGFGTDDENSNARLSVKPETIRRRMVYVPLRRANLPTMLNLFDFGDATTSLGKRPLTTVAPQALFMMNSGFVAERAGNLAQAALKDATLNPADRVRQLYVRILNRQADAGEIDSGLTYVSEFQRKFQDVRTESDAWMSFCRILIASNEFLYLE